MQRSEKTSWRRKWRQVAATLLRPPHLTGLLVPLVLLILASSPSRAEIEWTPDPPIHIATHSPVTSEANPLRVRPGQQITFTVSADDVDTGLDAGPPYSYPTSTDPLTYDWALFESWQPLQNAKAIWSTEAGSSITVSAPRKAGAYLCRCIVDDIPMIPDDPDNPDDHHTDDAPADPVFFYVQVVDSSDCKPDWQCNAPWDGAGSGSCGCAAGDPVNLISGQERYSTGPDITAYNKDGLPASYQRTFYTDPNYLSYGSPGLPIGWVDNYDYAITETY